MEHLIQTPFRLDVPQDTELFLREPNSASLTLVLARAKVKPSRARPNQRLGDPDSWIVESDSSVEKQVLNGKQIVKG